MRDNGVIYQQWLPCHVDIPEFCYRYNPALRSDWRDIGLAQIYILRAVEVIPDSSRVPEGQDRESDTAI
jgi:hypothetical protein